MRVTQLAGIDASLVLRHLCNPEDTVGECLEKLAAAGRCDALYFVFLLITVMKDVELPDLALVKSCDARVEGRCFRVVFEGDFGKVAYIMEDTGDNVRLVAPGLEEVVCSGGGPPVAGDISGGEPGDFDEE